MSIGNQQSFGIFLGNSVTAVWDFGFVCDSPAAFSALLTNIDGTETLLSPTQYTLFLNPPATDSLHHVGGTCTYPLAGPPIPNGTMLTLSRTLPLVQPEQISGQGPFSPTVTEIGLDNNTLLIQQVNARGGKYRGTWQTGLQYDYFDVVQDGTNGSNTMNYYAAALANLSGVWATDLAAGDWTKVIDIQYIQTLVAEAQAAEAAAVAAENAAIAAAAAAAAAAAVAAAQVPASLVSTSATSHTIGLGTFTFTTQPGKIYYPGEQIMVASNADGANYFHGYVDSYDPITGALVLTSTDIGGSGTFADWNIGISGPAGASGGGTGTVTSVSVATANGISGSVANPTTTPAMTLALGAITPTSVAATSTVQGTQLISTVATGTAPFTVASTTPVANLAISGAAGTVATIAGKITSGANVTITGAGTAGSPYNIASSGGSGVMVGRAFNRQTSYISGGGWPLTNFAPNIANGAQILTLTYTAASASNILRFTYMGRVYGGNPNYQVAAVLFKGSTPIACGSDNSNYGANCDFCFEAVAGDTAAHTYTVRIGGFSQNASVNFASGFQTYWPFGVSLLIEELTP